MSVEEELQESIEKAKDPFEKHVAATMAIIAACLAVVAVGGHLMTTEELLTQQKASDQWSYYQAKSIRRYQSEVARDLFSGMNMAGQSTQYQKNADKYRKDDDDIQKEAQGLEQEAICEGGKRSDSTSERFFWSFRSSWHRWRFWPSAKCCGTFPS